MDRKLIGLDGVNGINIAQDREKLWDVLYRVMNYRVPFDLENFSTKCENAGFVRRTLLHGVRGSRENAKGLHDYSPFFPQVFGKCNIYGRSVLRPKTCTPCFSESFA